MQSVSLNAADKSFLSGTPAGIDKPGMHLDSPIKMGKWTDIRHFEKAAAISSSDSSKARQRERGGAGGFKRKKFSSTGEQLEAEANQRAETRGDWGKAEHGFQTDFTAGIYANIYIYIYIYI